MAKIPPLRGILRKHFIKSEKPRYPPIEIKEPRFFITLPKLKDMTKVDVKYPLLEPFAYARIRWDTKEKNLKYTVEQPELTQADRRVLKKIESTLMEMIDIKMSVAMKRNEAVKYLESNVLRAMDELGMTLSVQRYIKLMYFVVRDFVGLNEIEPLLHDPFIEDFGLSGVDTPVYIVHRVYGSMVTNIRFDDMEYLNNFVIKLSERCGRYISYAKPLLGGTLPDGSRVQATLAKDVTTKGPTFSIRKFRRNPFSPVDIMNLGTASAEELAYLWFLVEHSASLLICGGVSTGKTTFLNSISMFIPPENKIVSIEDVREINLPHINWIPATARVGFGVPELGGRRYGEVTLFDLLKESFRMKPDYTIVGEVRGKEAYVMFQGMASGNPSMGTIHAGSVEDVVKRLETPPIELSPSLIESLDAIVVMISANEKGKSARRVKEIVEVQSIDSKTGKAMTIKSFAWLPSIDKFKDNTRESDLLRRISFERGITYEETMRQLAERKRVLEWMKRFNIVQFQDVSALVNLYYKDRKTLMEWVEKGLPPYKTKAKKEIAELWESATGLKIVDEK